MISSNQLSIFSALLFDSLISSCFAPSFSLVFHPSKVLHWVNSGPQTDTSTFIISRKSEQKSVGSLGAQAHYQCVCARHATVNLALIYIRKTQELGDTRS